MNRRVIRAFAALSVLAFVSACGHSLQVLPQVTHSASSAHARLVRGLTVIGGVTSRDSFNVIYATAGMGPAPGVEQVVDLGSIRDGGGAAPPPPQCTDPSDQCYVPSCDPSDADCVVLLAELGGPAKAGDTCGISSKPVGAPLKATGPNGTTERVADINFIVADYHNVEVPVGYIYTSDVTHQNYFQPNAAFAVGGGAIITGSSSTIEPPYVPMGNMTATEIAKAMNNALNAAKLLNFVVNPAAYAIIQGGSVGKAPCFSSPHSASWA